MNDPRDTKKIIRPAEAVAVDPEHPWIEPKPQEEGAD